MFVFTITLSIVFALAGIVKVFRAKPMVDQFKEFGLPTFAVQIVGTLEVAGAVGLLMPSFKVYAAIGLFILMIGAVFNHIKVKHPIKTILPAFVLGLASIVLIILLLKEA